MMDIPLDDTGLANPEIAYHKNLIKMLLVVVVLHGERGGRELSMNPPYGGRPGMIEGDAQDSAQRAEQSWGMRRGGKVRPGPQREAEQRRLDLVTHGGQLPRSGAVPKRDFQCFCCCFMCIFFIFIFLLILAIRL